MFDLKDHLDDLHGFNEARDDAKALREQAVRSLKGIQKIEKDSFGKFVPIPVAEGDEYYENPEWVCSGDLAEVASLVKVQNHQNIHERDEDNDEAEASAEMTERLTEIDLRKLLPDLIPADADEIVPVLLAARTMQALTARPETVFSITSMLCYYRIIRELYYAAAPDWTVGAARAGRGGRTSAFITSECIRAIFAFENAIKRTIEYLEHTRDLHERYLNLEAMLKSVGVAPGSDSPLSKWADKAIERMWLDWYVSTSPRNGTIALSSSKDKNNILPFPPKRIEPPDVNMLSVGRAFKILQKSLADGLKAVADNTKKVHHKIIDYRAEENRREDKRPLKKSNKEVGEEDYAIKDNIIDRVIDRTEGAYRRASKVIDKTYTNAYGVYHNYLLHSKSGLRTQLPFLLKNFKLFPRQIHRVLEPAKRYVRTVLDHELAIAHSGANFDAGELIFAATAFGTATNWQEKEKLLEACSFLVESLPDNGRFTTNRPFHANRYGYKLLPIGCEMTRSFAKLLHRTRYEFKPQLVTKMLNIFKNEKQFVPPRHEDDKKRAGWNFENAPDANKPCVWVTAISVLALDRIVRMLNHRINGIVYKHFKVITPDKPHSDLTLNELIYPDYGLSEYYVKNPEGSAKKKRSIAIRLEQMRAHVMRASLPDKYKKDDGNKERVFSAILYGPPGTGKTSLLEALASSSKVPLVMLSPSDLIVQGQEQLEGRAKAVFDALSMLTQSVILFDEFEPVLRRRVQRKDKDTLQNDDWVFEGLLGVTEAIRTSGASMLRFLLTGMLPKLVSLHDAAQKQSLVYCLGTNHLEEIDEAAKRGGRFDVHQPIFNPDPVSRAGTFLFRLQPVTAAVKKSLSNKAKRLLFAEIFRQIIVATANENAGELSRKFFKKLEEDEGLIALSEEAKRASYFAYALGLGSEREVFEEKVEKMRAKNFEEMKKEFEESKDRLDDEEKPERRWLFEFEQDLQRHMTEALNVFKKSGQSLADLELFLKDSLTYQGTAARLKAGKTLIPIY